MFELDVRSRKPIYEQLVDRYKELIINEVLRPDEKLPSVRILAQELTVNPNTIQKAYRELEQQGFIYSLSGKGSFVAPQSQTHVEEKVTSIKQDLRKLLAEAMFLGLGRDECIALIDEANQSAKGGEDDD